jgi:hypothetical protein
MRALPGAVKARPETFSKQLQGCEFMRATLKSRKRFLKFSKQTPQLRINESSP